MSDIKNPFSFGTGDIDKDLWLRDIDNEQEDFITRYGSATNKHRTALLRQAFQDLRTRIANGDMLNRTADGLYQFGSALNRDDKHMQEAYQRALGFMGDLARRQLSTPAPEPEKKKYSTKILNENLVNFYNPSGSQEAFASLWNSFTDDERKAKLKDFLTHELNDNLSNYLDVEGYSSMDNLKTRINDFLTDPSITNLNRLGFTKNYLNALTLETSELATKEKTEEELLADQELSYIKERELLARRKALDLALDADAFKGETLPVSSFYYNFGNAYASAKSGSDFMNKTSLELSNYFNNLGVNWRSLLSSTGGTNNIFRRNLARLFSKTEEGTYPYYDVIKLYFTPISDGSFLLNNTNEEHDRLVFLNPSTNGFLFNVRPKGNPYEQQVPSQKEGGVLKFLYGATIEDLDRLYKKESKLSKNLSYLEPNELLKEPLSQVITHTKEGDKKVSNMDTMDWVGILTPAILDLTSMVSANVPGYGTAVSAGTGIASTLWTGTREWQNAGWESGLKTLGMGLTADALGLIPGWGSSAKLGKIAKGLSKYAKYIGPALAAKGFGDAAGVVNKMFTKGTDSLTKDDMNTLLYGLVGLTSKGTAGVKRANRSNLERAAATQYRVTSRNGNTVTLNAEQLAKLRQQHKVKKATPVVTQDALIEANDQIMLASKWPMFGSVSLNRLLKMLDLKLASDKNVFKNTIWKPGKKGYTEIPAYKPYGLNSQDWGLNVKMPITKKQSLEKFKEFKDSYYKKKKATAKEQYGGVLKALRNGGIIKAQWGDNSTDWNWTKLNLEKLPTYVDNPYFPEITYNTVLPWYKERWNNTSLNSLVDSKKYTNPNLLGRYTGTNLDFAYNKNMAYVRSGLENKQADIQNYFDNSPLMYDGDLKTLTDIYNSDIDKLYNTFNKDLASPDYLKTDASPHNNLFKRVYASRATGKGDINSPDIGWDQNLIGIFGSNSFARRPVNYETKFEDDLKTNLDLARDRVSKIKYNGIEGYVYTDENGRIHPVSPELLKTLGINNKIPGTKEDSNKTLKSTTDKEIGIKTPLTEKLKDPFDPTLLTIAGKTLLGLRGNKDIYGNLLKEMPQAPMRDPIDRKLAIVGWQEQIKQGQNQLADLRNIYGKLVGSDALVNLAGALEVEGKGRDIMNDKFMKDSERLFTTALRSWDLDNDDYLRNNEIYYLNDKARKDRARMMAQIRAAWRSGDNNILMGALSDASNWWLKRYQREQDVVDRARGIELGTPESRMQERLVTELGDLANKKPSEMTAAEIAKVEATKAKILRLSNKTYASDYYNMFHVPGFGGGYYTTMAKDGTKLEVAKLKARGKDNDRYVSMIKDLRQSSRRRRRR